MDTRTFVQLIIIAFETITAGVLAYFMARAMGVTPGRALLTGVQIVCCWVMLMLPKPVPARHRVKITRRMVTA